MISLKLSTEEFKTLNEIMSEIGMNTERNFKDDKSVQSLCMKVSAPFIVKDEKAELIMNVFGVAEGDDSFSDLYRAMS